MPKTIERRTVKFTVAGIVAVVFFITGFTYSLGTEVSVAKYRLDAIESNQDTFDKSLDDCKDKDHASDIKYTAIMGELASIKKMIEGLQK